jgi:radical SAM superfamily enzyme YgiQ (UPF0313 family)
MKAGKGRVILYSPHYVDPSRQVLSLDYLATPPLPFLALGGPLREAGYDVRIIDAKWEPNARREIEQTIDGAVCLGVTGLTGYSVLDGLAISGWAKRKNPAIPVVWGGWHSTYAVRQAVRDPRVDIVVRGQGERSFVELLDALREKRPLRQVAGITYREGEEIVETPNRAPEPLDRLPPFAYELVEVERYIRSGPGPMRHAHTILSRGCPYECDFCLDSRQKWLGLPVGRIEAELKFWVLGQRVNSLQFYDGNFFLGRERLAEVARMISSGELADRFQWTATGVAKRIVQLDGELLSQLRRAGLRAVAIGAETGSEELLQRITNKTTVEVTTEAVRHLTRHGINQYLFFMVGYPGEPEGTLEATLGLIARLKRINPALDLQVNFCVPLPGSEMYRVAMERAIFPEPKTFEDWGYLDIQHPNLRYLGAGYESKVKRFLEYLMLAYPQRDARDSLLRRLVEHGAARWLYAPVRRAALWRVESQSFGFPVEAGLYRALRTWRVRRLLRTSPASREPAAGAAAPPSRRTAGAAEPPGTPC